MCYFLCLWIEDVYISISNLWFLTKNYLDVTIPNDCTKPLIFLRFLMTAPDRENKIIEAPPNNDFEGNNTIIILVEK